MRLAILLATAIAIASGCSRTASAELLDANFIANGQTAIDLIAPTQNQQVATSTLSFNWGARGAGLYTLELATDSNFTNKILEKEVSATTYTVANNDLTAGSALTTSTYYWRVKIAKIRDNLQSKTQSFLLMVLPSGGSGAAGALYVDKNSTASTQIGSKEAPYKTISGAIAAADALRNNNQSVTLDVRVAKGDYGEEVNLIQGISLRGGYDASDWSRNISTNVTRILGPTDAAVRSGSGVTNITVVEGFTLVGATISGTSSYGVYNNASSPTITNNYIDCGNGAQCYGIQNTSSSPVISGNTIWANNQTGNFGIYNQLSSSATIVNNLIFGGYGANNSVAIYVNGSAPKILNNTIHAGTATLSSVGIRMLNAAAPVIQNNIVFSSISTSICIEEFSAGLVVPNVENNNIFGCANLYKDNAATSYAFICTNGQPGSTGGCATGFSVATTTSGNISVSNGGPLFVSINGTDGNINTMSDNDWHLGTAAANCNVRGGGKDLSVSLTTDRDLISRTASLALSGACTPANTNAAGWSMGAYEND